VTPPTDDTPPPDPDRLPEIPDYPEDLLSAAERGTPGEGCALTPWERYTMLLRELDAVRAAEESRTAESRQERTNLLRAGEELEPFLIEQGHELGNLAERLRLRRPELSAADPKQVPLKDTPQDCLTTAYAQGDQAAVLANKAEQMGHVPAFMPRFAASTRNFMIYAMCAAGLAAVQFLTMMMNNGHPPFGVMIFIFPAVAFGIGLYLARVWGSAPLAKDPVIETSWRMGLIMCYVTGPVWMVFVALGELTG
jgi:hypothetical protein